MRMRRLSPAIVSLITIVQLLPAQTHIIHATQVVNVREVAKGIFGEEEFAVVDFARANGLLAVLLESRSKPSVLVTIDASGERVNALQERYNEVSVDSARQI